jgi:hypothetical protein
MAGGSIVGPQGPAGGSGSFGGGGETGGDRNGIAGTDGTSPLVPPAPPLLPDPGPIGPGTSTLPGGSPGGLPGSLPGGQPDFGLRPDTGTVSPIPEPATWATLLAGVAAVAAFARRRRGA